MRMYLAHGARSTSFFPRFWAGMTEGFEGLDLFDLIHKVVTLSRSDMQPPTPALDDSVPPSITPAFDHDGMGCLRPSQTTLLTAGLVVESATTSESWGPLYAFLIACYIANNNPK